MNARTPAEALGSASVDLADALEADLIEEYGEAVRRPANDTESFVRDLLWNDHPECCGCPVVGAEYMGAQEMICCGNPEPASLNSAQIVATLRAHFPEALQRPEQKSSHAALRSDDTEHAHTALSLALKASDAALQAMEELTPTLLVSDCLEMLAKAHTLIEEAKDLYRQCEPISAVEYANRRTL